MVGDKESHEAATPIKSDLESDGDKRKANSDLELVGKDNADPSNSLTGCQQVATNSVLPHNDSFDAQASLSDEKQNIHSEEREIRESQNTVGSTDRPSAIMSNSKLENGTVKRFKFFLPNEYDDDDDGEGEGETESNQPISTDCVLLPSFDPGLHPTSCPVSKSALGPISNFVPNSNNYRSDPNLVSCSVPAVNSTELCSIREDHPYPANGMLINDIRPTPALAHDPSQSSTFTQAHDSTKTQEDQGARHREEIRLQGGKHVFTVVPVASSDKITEDGETHVKNVKSNIISGNRDPLPARDPTRISGPARKCSQIIGKTYSPYNTMRGSPVGPRATFSSTNSPYQTVSDAGSLPGYYYPYHTVTGLVPSSYQSSVSGLKRLKRIPPYSRRNYGVGSGPSVPPSLAGLVLSKGSPMSSKMSLRGVGSAVARRRLATIPASKYTQPVMANPPIPLHDLASGTTYSNSAMAPCTSSEAPGVRQVKSQAEFRLQGDQHLFTVLPVNSSDNIIDDAENQAKTLEADVFSNSYREKEALLSTNNQPPQSDSLNMEPQRNIYCSSNTVRGYPVNRWAASNSTSTGSPYQTITSMGSNYNPYHTVTGSAASSFQFSDSGLRRVPTYSRRNYGVGSGSSVPTSLAGVVMSKGSPMASKGSLGVGHSTGIRPVATMPTISFARTRQHSATPPLPTIHTATVPLDQATVNSINQMTVMSSGSLSVDVPVGSTDGHNMTVMGTLMSPEQLPLLPEALRGDDGGGPPPSSQEPARQTWSNKAQFVLACIGYAVGLGNLWRFPYLCYKSGGGAFLIPYFIMLFLCGIPLLLMELAVGQYTRRGPIAALAKICPLFKGAGIGTVMISFLLCTYYNVIIAWAIFYLVQSFFTDLPWTSCNATWAIDCFDSYAPNVTAPSGSKSPTEVFFNEVVLQKSGGIGEMGNIRWELLLALIGAWVLVYFSLWKSIKSSGRVVYFTATIPYLFIGAFLWRALTLPGASKGLQYFFEPKWELLGKAEVWVNAASQNFNSIGIAFGSLIAFSSYNKFDNNIVLDTWAISLTNCLTSLLAGTIVFSTLGNIAHETGRDIDDVVAEGPGLVFMVYPQALAKMPYANVWAVLFFSMLLVLGLDSQFATVEVIITSMQDAFPKWIRKHLKRHEFLVLIVCCVSFLFGLPNIMQGGIYYFQLIDYYAAAVSLMYLAFFEVVAIVWVYGANRLARNVREMTGKLPSLYFRFCWYFSAPVLILAIWIFSMVDYKRPTYNKGEYEYPDWAIGIGWIIASLSLAPIPIFAVIAVINAKGTTFLEKLKNSAKSCIEECPCCGEALDGDEDVHSHAGRCSNQVKLVVYSTNDGAPHTTHKIEPLTNHDYNSDGATNGKTQEGCPPTHPVPV